MGLSWSRGKRKAGCPTRTCLVLWEGKGLDRKERPRKVVCYRGRDETGYRGEDEIGFEAEEENEYLKVVYLLLWPNYFPR